MSRFLLELPPLSTAQAAAAVLLAAGALAYAVRLWAEERALSLKAVLFFPRMAAAVLAALLLCRPSIVYRKPASPPVAVVVDASESMSVRDGGEGGSSRAEAVRAALSARSEFLQKRAAPLFFSIGSRLQRISSPEEALLPQKDSDFSLLSRLPDQAPGVKAVFFFSDGRRGGGPDPAPALAALGLPVHAVGAGGHAAGPDLSIEGVRASPFGFKGADAEASVRLRLRGAPAAQATLRVIQRGETVGKRSVRCEDGVLETTVSFRPARTGLETFRVSLSPLPDEENLINNETSFTVDVTRDRRRFLYICGRPGPHYAFLRHQIKTDPSSELVSFVILRDPEDFLSVPDRELSLIPFPEQKQLMEGLSGFDAVIFEDFSFHRFGLGREGMAALRRYVEGGGGFLLSGEGSFFGPASPYRASPMEPLIPFRLDLTPVPGPSRFEAEPLSGGFFLAPDGEAAWRGLPPLEGDGFFPAALRPGAAPLAGGGGLWGATFAPGRGRVMALANVSTWRWALGDPRGGLFYSRFWRQALSWLSGDEEFRRVRLEVPSGGAAPGEDLLFRAFVRDEGGAPLTGAQVFLEASAPGWKRDVRMDPAGAGEYLASISFENPGAAVLKARAFRDGKLLGESAVPFRVGTDWDESRDLSTDFSGLEGLSRSTGGRFVPLKGFDEAWLAERIAEASWEVRGRASLGGLWTAVLLAVLLLAEWTFRRWRGLP